MLYTYYSTILTLFTPDAYLTWTPEVVSNASRSVNVTLELKKHKQTIKQSLSTVKIAV